MHAISCLKCMLFRASNPDVWRLLARSERTKRARCFWSAYTRFLDLYLTLLHVSNACYVMPQILMYCQYLSWKSDQLHTLRRLRKDVVLSEELMFSRAISQATRLGLSQGCASFHAFESDSFNFAYFNARSFKTYKQNVILKLELSSSIRASHVNIICVSANIFASWRSLECEFWCSEGNEITWCNSWRHTTVNHSRISWRVFQYIYRKRCENELNLFDCVMFTIASSTLSILEGKIWKTWDIRDLYC